MTDAQQKMVATVSKLGLAAGHKYDHSVVAPFQPVCGASEGPGLFGCTDSKAPQEADSRPASTIIQS